MKDLKNEIKAIGARLEFDEVGIAGVNKFKTDQLSAKDRVRKGLFGGLSWFTEERVMVANTPEDLLPGCKSIISVAISYFNEGQIYNDGKLRGKVARYAWGLDYHDVIKQRLRLFVLDITKLIGSEFRSRIFVDDGAMNDRAAAERAGIGWFGKNSNILTSSHGSWVFLGQIITDLDIVADSPNLKTCGDCQLCITKCPTGAIEAPYTINNDLCISFLTIELKGVIPRDLRPLIGDWVFGCDICQDVCPVNIDVVKSQEKYFKKRHDFDALDLLPLLSLNEEEFRYKFKNSPIKRAKLEGLKRNVCVALGNLKDKRAIAPLLEAVLDKSFVVRVHAVWAIWRIGIDESTKAYLLQALNVEKHPEVIKELEYVLKNLGMLI